MKSEILNTFLRLYSKFLILHLRHFLPGRTERKFLSLNHTLTLEAYRFSIKPVAVSIDADALPNLTLKKIVFLGYDDEF